MAFDIVFDFVIPRFPLGEVGARESEDPERICQILDLPMIFLSYDPPYLNPSLPDEKLGVFAVLGLVGVAAD